MGKRKSAKPQKYVQPSEDEEEDNVDGYSEADKPEDLGMPVVLTEKNSRSLWTKEKPPEDFKKENNRPPPKESVESAFWASHFPIRPDSTNSSFDFNHFKADTTCGIALHENSPRVHSSPLETLLSERIFGGGSYAESERPSGTESDRRSESEHQRGRGKRRRKYVTYPATFRLEVVEHAERHGKSSSAKKYNICVEKVSMWCKTKDNIVHKVKKGGATEGSFEGSYEDRTEDGVMEDDVTEDKRQDNHNKAVQHELEILYNNDDSDEAEVDKAAERQAEVVYPVHFKLRVAKAAEEKGEREAALEYRVCEKRVAVWRGARDWLAEQVALRPAEEWELDLYVRLKRLLEEPGGRVTVRELIVRAEQAQLATSSSSGATISTAWLTEWCHKFRVCFRSVMESTPQPLTENTCLVLETSLFQVDREEQLQLKRKLPPQVQDLIDCSRTLDASSDREDSSAASSPFLFSSKRRRRSYTLAFKLEVVKFAQSNTKHATSRKYGIARRVISRWIADKESLQTDLMNATQHALTDSTTEEIDTKLLHYYKELTRKGVRVSKGMLVERANSLFGGDGMSATNGWFRHWVVKWKERGEKIDIAEDEPSTEPDDSAPLDLHKPSADQQKQQQGGGVSSSMDALKQAYMTNAILSTMRPTDRDLQIMSQFPELLHLIQTNPAILGAAAAQLQQSSSDIYRNSLQQSVVNLTTTNNNSRENNGEIVYDASVSGKKPLPTSVKKRRERYSPDFKLMVIEYASSHSYQETSRKFGVHHITVSEWCKDKERIHKKVYCDNLQTLHSKILKSETAEHKFLAWIQECNRARIAIRPQDVQGKASEILNEIGEAEVKKNCWWFYLWNKRGMTNEATSYEDEDVLEKESRVNYPPAVKVEIAKVAERQSVNCAARCFRVARKRIREWVKSKDKLRWLAETGQVRERGGAVGGGKRVSCLDVDKEVYAWYEQQTTPPRLPEIRSKALQIFQKHGFGNMKCSREWYRGWCKRYGVSRSGLPRDDRLIRWILARYDKNLPISNQELVEHVVAERMKTGVTSEGEVNMTAEEEVYAFCRRYPRLLEALPSVSETFPEEMEAEVNRFRVTLRELQEENGFPSTAIGCMDEVPLLFTASGHERRVIVNSGMGSWNAVVILSCLADGQLLPPMIILKGKEEKIEGCPHVVFQEERLVVDTRAVCRWAEEVWLPSVPSPSLLLLDCFQPHCCPSLQEQLLERGVTPVLLPEGCASKLQPLNACVTRSFQQLVKETWEGSGSSTAEPGDVARCIAAAFKRLKEGRRDAVRRSFVVTGVAVAPDGSEDAMIENSDWFGGSGDERVLSPASESDSDPEA